MVTVLGKNEPAQLLPSKLKSKEIQPKIGNEQKTAKIESKENARLMLQKMRLKRASSRKRKVKILYPDYVPSQKKQKME